MNQVIDILINYWFIVAIVLIVVALFLLRYAKGQAKTTALQYLAAAEKMVFANADVKWSSLEDAAYNALPARIRVLVPLPLFITIMQSAYQEIKNLVDDLHNNVNVPAQKKETPQQ